MSFKDAVSKLRSYLGVQYQEWIEIDFSEWRNSDDEVDKFARIKNAILEYNYMDKDLLLVAKDDELGRKLQDLELPVRKRVTKRR